MNFYNLDGAANMSVTGSTYTILPIIDTIQEFKIQSHNDQAEFGGVLGGVINVVTKSGTNSLHGAGWEYVRNNFFDAQSVHPPEYPSPESVWRYGRRAGNDSQTVQRQRQNIFLFRL
jgi:hypothetical protein